jgi:hypothetical protein
VEEGVPANDVRLLLEDQAALRLHLLQSGEVSEPLVRERLVGERPEVFGRLELRGIRGQDQEVNALRDHHLRAGVPARPIEHQEEVLLRSCPDVTGERGQDETERLRRDGGKQPPLCLPGGGTDKATDVEPLVALLHGGNRPLPNWCPDAPDQGQEADAVFVGRPELDLDSRMRGPNRGDVVSEDFF